MSRHYDFELAISIAIESCVAFSLSGIGSSWFVIPKSRPTIAREDTSDNVLSIGSIIPTTTGGLS
jgi:hypothetical protein